MKRFEDSIAWQKSRELCSLVYKETKNIKDPGFKNQIQRAAVSIMNNIAEGFERDGNKEFRRFLYMAKGSAGEVRSMLSLAEDLEYLNQKALDKLNQQVNETSKVVAGLIKKL